MSYLRQSTASQSRTLGPFIDDTDFVTEEPGLTIANTDVKLLKNGGVSVNKNSGGGTHRINGMYGFTFDATDTDTVGELEVSISVAGALPVFKTFTVLEEAIYDGIFASGAARVPSDMTALSGGVQSATDLRDFADAGYNPVTNAVTSCANVEVVGPGAISSLSFQANSIVAGAIAAGALNGKGDWNIGKTGYSILGTKTTLDALNDFDPDAVLTEGYAADGAAFTMAQGMYMLWSSLSEFSIASTTITAKQLDGTTTAMTFTLDDATNPTSRTRAT